MAKEKKIITALNYGELHMYYPLKFDTKPELFMIIHSTAAKPA